MPGEILKKPSQIFFSNWSKKIWMCKKKRKSWEFLSHWFKSLEFFTITNLNDVLKWNIFTCCLPFVIWNFSCLTLHNYVHFIYKQKVNCICKEIKYEGCGIIFLSNNFASLSVGVTLPKDKLRTNENNFINSEMTYVQVKYNERQKQKMLCHGGYKTLQVFFQGSEL